MGGYTSRNNPKLKLIRRLRQRKVRQETGLFLVEGIRHVGEAVAAGAELAYLCYAPEQLDSAFARDLIAKQQAAGVPCLAVDGETFASLTEKDNPQSILAVVKQKSVLLQDLNTGNFPWGVALVAPQDPGNIGAILRTIDAVGASGLLLLDNSVDPYHPSAVRASMGALFWLPIAQISFDEFITWVKGHHYHLVGTSAHASLDYRQVARYEKPLIILFGSEREGLSVEQSAQCDYLIRLPMAGRVTSLNLAVAAGIVLYHVLDRS